MKVSPTDQVQEAANVESTGTLSGPVSGNGNAAEASAPRDAEGEEGLLSHLVRILL